MNGRRLALICAIATIATLAVGFVIPPRVHDASGRFRVVASGLDGPWEIAIGPDGYLWVTERAGPRITRVNPSDGSKITAATLADVYVDRGQNGLLGMALHPDLLRGAGHDYVYVAYTYDADPGPGVLRRGKVRRYTYDARTHTLDRPTDLIVNLPASLDHLGFRMIFGPDQKLYLSIGDQGNNGLRSPCPPNRAQELPSASAVLAQDWTGYQGKVLRMNLDGSIPTDNPVLAGVRSHIFSYGHRNPQGLVFGPTGILYESEHGPDTDDELNILEGGRNYGWPNVAGYNDDQAYTYAAWFASSPAPCASLHFSTTRIPPSVPQQRESAWHAADFAPPILTLFTVPAGYDPETQGRATVAPSGIDISATKDSAEGWATSLWITSLTRGRIYRVDLTADGRAVKGTFTEHFRSVNRYRDVAIDPSRHRVYIVTDATGSTRDVNGHETRALENPGAILEFFDREGTSWALSKVEAGGPGADKGGFVNSGTRLISPMSRATHVVIPR